MVNIKKSDCSEGEQDIPILYFCNIKNQEFDYWKRKTLSIGDSTDKITVLGVLDTQLIEETRCTVTLLVQN